MPKGHASERVLLQRGATAPLSELIRRSSQPSVSRKEIMIAPSMATAEIGDQIATTNGIENAGTAITMRHVLSRIDSSHISSRPAVGHATPKAKGGKRRRRRTFTFATPIVEREDNWALALVERVAELPARPPELPAVPVEDADRELPSEVLLERAPATASPPPA
jgi:hypothetical protein